jgi:hypothetical protein
MDRKLLKSQAKDLIRTSDPKPVYFTIISLVIIAVFSFLSYKIVGNSYETISLMLREDVNGLGSEVRIRSFAWDLRSLRSMEKNLLVIIVLIIAWIIFKKQR